MLFSLVLTVVQRTRACYSIQGLSLQVCTPHYTQRKSLHRPKKQHCRNLSYKHEHRSRPCKSRQLKSQMSRAHCREHAGGQRCCLQAGAEGARRGSRQRKGRRCKPKEVTDRSAPDTPGSAARHPSLRKPQLLVILYISCRVELTMGTDSKIFSKPQ